MLADDTVPLELFNCAHWIIEGLVVSSEHNPDVAMGVDVGTPVYIVQ